MTQLTLEAASMIIDAALAKGAELGLKPLSVAVVDVGSHLIAFQRQDGSSTLRAQIAHGKAAGALALGISSRKVGEIAAERPSFISSLAPLSPFGLIPAAGGVILADEHGLAIGAVGVTGDTSDNDELCAFAGAAAAGLLVRK